MHIDLCLTLAALQSSSWRPQTRLTTTSSTFEVTPRATHGLQSSSFEATEESIAAMLDASHQARKSSDLSNGTSK